MIGNPKVIFIDEATTGIDPASRGIVWQGIKQEGRNSAVVYTTHAMEEAEAISDKLTIMVDGVYKCFGTLEDIKECYGQSFDVMIKFSAQEIPATTVTAHTKEEVRTYLSGQFNIDVEKEFSADKEAMLLRFYEEFM